MQKSLIAATVAVCCCLAASAQAVPRLTYNFLTGNIRVYNDVPNSIINIKSPKGVLHAPTLPNGPIGGGGNIDLGDLPNFIAILNTPTTDYLNGFKLGDGTADPGIPGTGGGFDFVPDPQYLAFDWYTAFGQPANRGYWIPEPSSGLLIASSLLGFLAARRRRVGC